MLCIVLLPDADDLGAVPGGDVELQSIAVHLVEERLDMLKLRVGVAFIVQEPLELYGRDPGEHEPWSAWQLLNAATMQF